MCRGPARPAGSGSSSVVPPAPAPTGLVRHESFVAPGQPAPRRGDSALGQPTLHLRSLHARDPAYGSLRPRLSEPMALAEPIGRDQFAGAAENGFKAVR